jgi:FtsP/CotA-like multicopper oxidase with cupredoxin domain
LLALLFSVSVSGLKCDAENVSRPTIHIYYIAADEVMRNYAPRGQNLTGTPGPELEGGSRSSTLRKAVYREYMDASFSTLKPRPAEWEHLGILGPLIRAEVGDTIRIFFKNNTKIICSMHPHGLEYAKDSEGAMYADGASSDQKKGD